MHNIQYYINAICIHSQQHYSLASHLLVALDYSKSVRRCFSAVVRVSFLNFHVSPVLHSSTKSNKPFSSLRDKWPLAILEYTMIENREHKRISKGFGTDSVGNTGYSEADELKLPRTGDDIQGMCEDRWSREYKVYGVDKLKLPGA